MPLTPEQQTVFQRVLDGVGREVSEDVQDEDRNTNYAIMMERLDSLDSAIRQLMGENPHGLREAVEGLEETNPDLASAIAYTIDEIREKMRRGS